MPFLVAALLLGAVSPPPPDDDDDKPVVAAPAGAQPVPDADDEKPAATSPAGSQPTTDEDDEEGDRQAPSTIVVTARKLDAARSEIDAALGSSVYSLTNDTIENRPSGETGSIADILSQAPGVTLSNQGLMVRGSRANQVRINNVIVPEAISDPADQISSRLAETTKLVTGTLPAQYGFAPAGVISVTTKNGLYSHGGQIELFAGSNGMIEPAFEWAGSAADTSLFASGDLEHERTRVADGHGFDADDKRIQISGLLFADHLVDENDRVSLIVGGSSEHRAIGKTSIGRGTELNSNGYAVGTFQHSSEGFTLQASLFAGTASNHSHFASVTHERNGSFGTQVDGSKALGKSHILRFGLLATHSATDELALPGTSSSSSRTSLAVYGEDEWTIAPSVTFNPGLRVEWLRGLGGKSEVEPRASIVWQALRGLTAHAGYARYSSAPSPGRETASLLPDERDDVFDVGLQQKLGRLTLGADAYSRSAHDYLAEHENLGSAVPIDFSFGSVRIRGIEFSATYDRHGTSAWANLSLSKAAAKTIIGGKQLFAPATIAAASARFVPLASDRPLTFSGGLVQQIGKFSLSGDVLVSSGPVRTLTIFDPNGSRGSAYAVLGLAAVYHARIAGEPADLRLDLTNLTNVKYALSDASNLEGGWTTWGQGRAITIGIEQGF